MKASVAKYVNECKGHVKNFDKLDNRMKAVILSQQYVGNYYFKKTKNGTGQCHKYVTKEQNVDDIKEIMKIMYDNADDGKRTMSDVILLDSYRVEI